MGGKNEEMEKDSPGRYIGIGIYIQGVFFNWAHPEFAKCRPVSNQFQKNDRVPDWPPPHDEKKTKCLRTSM